MGITKLYPWQCHCLRELRAGHNLLYSVPTSGGKTLVAELWALHNVLVRRRDVLFMVPYVSLVHERAMALEQLALRLQRDERPPFCVELYAGAAGKVPPLNRRERRSIFVATYEKATALLSFCIQDRSINRFGLVVVDEVHMIGAAGHRGASLEVSLSILAALAPTTRLQLTAMSATISNASQLARFLRAKLHQDVTRPVDLHEHVVVDGVITPLAQFIQVPAATTQCLGRRIIPRVRESRHSEDVQTIASLMRRHEGQTLVFLRTRRGCEAMAQQVAQLQCQDASLPLQPSPACAQLFLDEEVTFDARIPLHALLVQRLAFHHAGLSLEDRALVEAAYRRNLVDALFCTTTLAAGVNLPARTVILKDLQTGMRRVTKGDYQQMIGRAGRTGLAQAGDAYLILSATQVRTRSGLPPHSSLMVFHIFSIDWHGFSTVMHD
ncbi:uncharacterized protein MONBRDRAFT_16697 [Monosiga brevicollis MX1]|uniref:Uncharacterized protein n=1 Tax=Monosiga brevicollis TaxID=81824 RepID=A9UY94_MONBE|nr:uncharacterized protein MONBRDRAFT_16697 [Monosiga brevicollis MX1]EDQ89819.1 predicted protein [Monosiga brevicollis MX1]|eukprot:XP_001745241.1 hypothetical protein [Monosiga brevicollis MX1]